MPKAGMPTMLGAVRFGRSGDGTATSPKRSTTYLLPTERVIMIEPFREFPLMVACYKYPIRRNISSHVLRHEHMEREFFIGRDQDGAATRQFLHYKMPLYDM